MTMTGAILLVEDNQDDVVLMKHALRSAGVGNPIYLVENGDEAVNYLAGTDKFQDREVYPMPTVIFLDLKLPLRTGHEVLTWIRAQTELEGVIVVMLTSSDQPADLRRAYGLGANSYLIKPPNAHQLNELAKAFGWEWLKGERAKSTPPAVN